MAPALTAEPLSPKEKLISTASPSASIRSSSSSGGDSSGGGGVGVGGGGIATGPGLAKKPSTPIPATATTRITRSASAAQQRSPIVINNNNKRKSSSIKSTNDTMGLSTAPNPHSSSTTEPVVASTSDSINSAANSTSTSPLKDNSTAQLLADLTINFEETLSAEICLRKTLPEVSLGKEPATSTAVTSASSESVGGGVAVAGQLLIPAVEELPKIETDNLEERLSQLDGNASGIPVEQLAAQLPPPPPIAQEPAAPSTPSRSQQPAQQQLESPLQARHQQMTPQSTTSSINFLKDGAAGEVLEDQDIEEVLKALKTFDGGHVNPDAICEFFSDVWEETPPAAPIATTAPANLPEALAEGTKPSISSVIEVEAPAKPGRPWQESHAELEQQQHVITRRIDFLLRRMRKYQARQMCRHTSEEVAGVFEWSARSSHKTPNPVRSSTLSEQEATVQSIVSGRPSVSFWEDQKKHPLPASQMGSLMRHIATAAKHQQICNTTSGSSATLAPSSSWYNSSNSSSTIPGKRPRKNQLDAATPAGTIGNTTTAASGSVGEPNVLPRADDIVPNYDTYVTSELTHVAGLLHTELREVQNAIDSDATESSSGGESADEMVTYNNTQQRSLSISRRAVWRYSRDRAAIALRWSWLCAQLTDLEMKIRQHSDLYLELTQSKGQVQLVQSDKSEVGPEPANHQGEEATSSDWLCSRARPLVVSEFRKRKLFQTTNMHTISKKAARPSNIKCGCQWPHVPCALCTGREDPTAPRELAETMMPATRVALLDPGYHPVLSFASDVSQSAHLEAIARQPDWQYRVMRSQAKAIAKSVWKAEREAVASGGGAGGGHAGSRRSGDGVKRRYIRRKERNNNSNKDAGSGTGAPGGGAGVGVGVGIGGGDSGNGTGTATTSSSSTTPTTTPLVANSKLLQQQQQQQSQNPTGTNSSSSPWTDSRQRQRQRHHSPSSTSISATISGAKKSRKSTNTTTSNSTTQHNNNNYHLNGYGDRYGDQHSRSRRNSSPSHGHRNERSSERRIRPVYDIDNIVIPYSMAAQTRVEILPYKEIPTPKWRIVDSDGDKAKQSAQADDSSESKLTNGQTEAEQAQAPEEGQPPKVNGLRQKQKEKENTEAVKHNNNNNTNVNNNRNGLVNGNAGKEETKLETKLEEKAIPEKNDEIIPKEEPAKKPKLNGKITKTPSAVAEEEPPLPKRAKLEKANGQVLETLVAESKPEDPKTQENEEDGEMEDLSDEAFIARHHLAMLEERQRYETFLKFPWTPRPRANRRIDSRAESSGANTPDPASPAPPGAGNLDNESIPSPLAHPLEGFNESGELISTGQSRPNRRRTTSSKLKDQAERRSTTPDLREAYAMLPSFEPLQFPLSEEVYQRMLEETYATPRYLTVSKRAKSKSVSSNCDGSSSQGAGSKAGSRRSSKTKTKLNGQINGHPAAAKSNGVGKDGDVSEPEEEDLLLEEEEDDYPKHHLVPLDDEQQSAPDVEPDVYDEAIKAYLGDQEGLDEDLGNDPFEDDDPNDPEWRNRTDGVRSRRA
ncbi:hypothetical protein KR074_007166 [Drosophila pseudoananassae]|nr:hypothetical protein KR074_007166 [Drosophila pseudoananassae]